MGRETILVADSDLKTVKLLGAALEGNEYTVVTAGSKQQALELLENEPVSLAIGGAKLDDASGLEFLSTLRQHTGLSDLPFIYLCKEGSVSRRIEALEMGADECLIKPIYTREITERVRSLFQGQLKDKIRKGETDEFQGNLEQFSLLDLMQTVHSQAHSGRLDISGLRQKGLIFFRNGTILDARCGSLRGEEAVYRVACWGEGTFRLQLADEAHPKKIYRSTRDLILEAIERVSAWKELTDMLPPLNRVFEIDYEQVSELVKEGSQQRSRVARLFDGVRTIRDVVDDSPYDDPTTLEVIRELFENNWLHEVDVVQTRSDTNTSIEEVEPSDRQASEGATSEGQNESPRFEQTPVDHDGDSVVERNFTIEKRYRAADDAIKQLQEQEQKRRQKEAEFLQQNRSNISAPSSTDEPSRVKKSPDTGPRRGVPFVSSDRDLDSMLAPTPPPSDLEDTGESSTRNEPASGPDRQVSKTSESSDLSSTGEPTAFTDEPETRVVSEKPEAGSEDSEAGNGEAEVVQTEYNLSNSKANSNAEQPTGQPATAEPQQTEPTGGEAPESSSDPESGQQTAADTDRDESGPDEPETEKASPVDDFFAEGPEPDEDIDLDFDLDEYQGASFRIVGWFQDLPRYAKWVFPVIGLTGLVLAITLWNLNMSSGDTADSSSEAETEQQNAPTEAEIASEKDELERQATRFGETARTSAKRLALVLGGTEPYVKDEGDDSNSESETTEDQSSSQSPSQQTESSSDKPEPDQDSSSRTEPTTEASKPSSSDSEPTRASSDIDSKIERAEKLIRQGQTSEAQNLIRELARKAPGNPEVAGLYLDIATNYYQSGQKQMEKKSYEKYLRLQPSGQRADEVRSILNNRF